MRRIETEIIKAIKAIENGKFKCYQKATTSKIILYLSNNLEYSLIENINVTDILRKMVNDNKIGYIDAGKDIWFTSETDIFKQ